MAKRNRKTLEAERLQRNHYAIREAQWLVRRSALGPLLAAVTVEECVGIESDPEVACVDPAKGLLRLNPLASSRGEESWAWAIAHLLLHLGLNHAARREDREPFLWNVACDEAADKLLPLFFKANRDSAGFYASADEQEEAIYDRLLEEQQARKRKAGGVRQTNRLATYAGEGRPDILGLGRVHAWRHDYEALLAEGIRHAVEDAISRTAAALEGQAFSSGWEPAERARRWVMNELPLLGALAAQVRILAEPGLCRRMDISIAAVNGFLMEMYFNPEWKFSQEEILFIYVHELLHVALLHHTRIQGRDPDIWNFACDFVINGWLVEMGVGRMPPVGTLYDPRVKGMSAEAVYDLLIRDPRRCKGLRGFRGKRGDVLTEGRNGPIYRDDVTTLDDIVRRCIAAGLACPLRGLLPAGLLEEIRSLFTPPVPWDVELARWMDAHVPALRDPRRTYARASRRQSSTPDIPRPARYVPQEWKEACTFGVVLDTSGSMDRELLGRALGAVASYAEARDVPAVRLVLCDAAPYDKGIVPPNELRGIFCVQGRGGTVLQPAVSFLLSRPDFPPTAPIMILTDGWCEEELIVPRDHCFLLPRKGEKEDYRNRVSLRTSAPVFRVLKESLYEFCVIIPHRPAAGGENHDKP